MLIQMMRNLRACFEWYVRECGQRFSTEKAVQNGFKRINCLATFCPHFEARALSKIYVFLNQH